MPTTYNVISLGLLADLDTVEGNNQAENASALVGMTFGGVGDPLLDYFVSFSPGSTGFAGGQSQRYDQDNSPNEAFSINGGPDQIFDSAVRYNATITYVDGTTASVEAIIFQDVFGNSYMAPEINAGANQTAFESGAIRSITLDSVRLSTTSGLVADRQAFNFVTCFTPGALIRVPGGTRAVECLQAGDLVVTADDKAQPVRWIGRATKPCTGGMRPIKISAGSLGAGLPRRDLIVSPQHRMLVRSNIVARMTGRAEVLIPANKLLPLPGVSLVQDWASVTYLHLLFDRHQIIYAEGAATESLLVGPQAERLIGPEAIAELEHLFPGLRQDTGLPARLVLDGAPAKRLVARHLRNQKELLAETVWA